VSKHDHDGHDGHGAHDERSHHGAHDERSHHDDDGHHDDNVHHDASHAGHDVSPSGYDTSLAGYDVEHGGGREAGHVDHAGHGGPVGSDLGGAYGSDAYGRGYARLEDADLTLRMGKDEEAKRLGRAQRRLLHLRLINGGQLNEGRLGPPVCIVFEGWDAAGKGGAIKRLVEPLDPRHVHIAPFAAPTPDELRHHFLWRFWPPLPGWGGMTIFDRSWYGRVLVERVEDLATEVQWRRAYQEINDFEHTLAEEGMIVIKLWMHLSHEEQLRRFVRRRDDPLKSWKLTEEDWRNREKRGAYEAAVSDMLRLTCGPLAHWDVIAGENKRYGRVQVIETVIRRMEQGMRRWGIDVPSHEAADEEFELALVIDDAEYQPDPAAVAAAKAAGEQAAGAAAGGSADASAVADAPAGAAAPAGAGAPASSVDGDDSDRRRMEA
jgi:polyphosphate kinase 2 (PPK2 family)